jgi:hypothetical protein
VCIYIHENLEFSTISLAKYCKEKDIKVCAVKLNITDIKLIILAIYRSASGNFNKFLKNLDSVLNTWYSNKIEFIICGDKSVNY